MNELLLNLSSREILSSSQNACSAAGLRPDPMEELERSPRHPSRSGCHGRVHSPAAVRVLCGDEGGGFVEEAEMNEKGYFQIRQRFRLQVKIHVWRPGFARTR